MHGISNENSHLLIMDGYNSLVILNFAHTAQKVGLGLLTIAIHTSHATQPLDISIFKLFKTAFRKFGIFGPLENKGKGAVDEDLAQWILLALKKTMTPKNIQKEFIGTSIGPSNQTTMNDKMGPNEVFVNATGLVTN